MSCDCSVTPNSSEGKAKPIEQARSDPTTVSVERVNDVTSPTTMLPGENIECYARRASTNGKNDVAEKIENTIDNTSIVCDLDGYVNEQFKLTPGSTRAVKDWRIKIDGAEQFDLSSLSIRNLQLINGRLHGTIVGDLIGRNFRILIIAEDEAGLIDSKEYTLTSKKATRSDSNLRFMFPYEPNGRVTCSFGPRRPPAPGASSMHKGIDISQPGSSLGYILAASDGVVVRCGPAAGYGNWIVIEHRDSSNAILATTVYGHMNEIYVTNGQKVSAGQRIAREGNAGIGSASHLHFELHKGKFGNPVDPIPYINGQFSVAQNNIKGQFGVADENTFTNVSNAKRGMSKEEKRTECSKSLPQQQIPNQMPDSISAGSENIDAKKIVEDTLNADSALAADDKEILLTIAKIQSKFNPTAKNPSSTAKGIFQMTDRVAGVYYPKVGADPSGSDRYDPKISTMAQVRFYKDEMLKYWTEFNATKLPGPAKLAGKTLSKDLSEKYSSLTKGEFLYGLIHHDGVNNAINGRDRQGVELYRRHSGQV